MWKLKSLFHYQEKKDMFAPISIGHYFQDSGEFRRLRKLILIIIIRKEGDLF